MASGRQNSLGIKMITKIRIQPESFADPLERFLSRYRSTEAASASPSPTRALVDSPYGRTFCNVSPETLKDVSTEFSRDLEWYFERYVSQEPFAKSRAEYIRRRLRDHGRRLLRDFFTTEIIAKLHAGSHLLIQIHDGSASLFHNFHWELLEDETLWREELSFEPASIHIIRVHAASLTDQDVQLRSSTADGLSIRRGTRSMNVLAITARPFSTKDIPHRLITRSIAAATRIVEGSSDLGPRLEIVRPGSFAAMTHHLEKLRPVGFFDVVHLDMHGILDNQG
jgi:hypothetical protein